MFLQSFVLAAGIASQASLATGYKYVAVFSVDGLHGSDLPKYTSLRPQSTIASLLQTGYEYTSAYTSAPSDSFPGTVALFTGARPRTSGVWYDDTYDRTFWDPFSTSGTNCSGPPGAEVVYDESKDYNSTELFSGGIDPVNLPQTLVNGKCTNLYPHQRLRVNTVFEVANAAGLQTAYADKHPAYDLVRGPSGKGLSVGYFPEIAAVPNTVDDTITYDKLHLEAFLEWIDGKTPDHSEGSLSGPPQLFGGNFQSVSVAQKLAGYLPKTLDFSVNLTRALDFVDDSLGKIVSTLKTKGFYDDTLIIVASKHGQAPIDVTKLRIINDSLIAPATGVNTSFVIADDVALVFLENQADTDAAVAGLNANRLALGIADLTYGPQLIERGFGNPATDPAVPDIIITVVEGVVYTTAKKIAEHGGLNEDDRHVACFVSNPKLAPKKYPCHVSTRQVAPTILKALGLDAGKLEGVQIEGTIALDGF